MSLRHDDVRNGSRRGDRYLECRFPVGPDEDERCRKRSLSRIERLISYSHLKSVGGTYVDVDGPTPHVDGVNFRGTPADESELPTIVENVMVPGISGGGGVGIGYP